MGVALQAVFLARRSPISVCVVVSVRQHTFHLNSKEHDSGS